MRAERRRRTSGRHEIEAQGGLSDRHPGGARDAEDRRVGAVAPAQRRPGQARRRRKDHGAEAQGRLGRAPRRRHVPAGRQVFQALRCR